MTERAYTLREIDRMRELIAWRLAPWRAVHIEGQRMLARDVQNVDRALVEERLRTYMMAGITVEEIEADHPERYFLTRIAIFDHRLRAKIDVRPEAPKPAGLFHFRSIPWQMRPRGRTPPGHRPTETRLGGSCQGIAYGPPPALWLGDRASSRRPWISSWRRPNTSTG